MYWVILDHMYKTVCGSVGPIAIPAKEDIFVAWETYPTWEQAEDRVIDVAFDYGYDEIDGPYRMWKGID